MSIDRGVDKEDVVHTYNGILVIKKVNDAICSNMDGPGDCHTEWRNSEKEKYHMILFMYGIEKEMIQMNLFTK